MWWLGCSALRQRVRQKLCTLLWPSLGRPAAFVSHQIPFFEIEFWNSQGPLISRDGKVHPTSFWWSVFWTRSTAVDSFLKIQSVLCQHNSHPSYMQNKLIPSLRRLRTHLVMASGSGSWSRILSFKSRPSAWGSAVAVPWVKSSKTVFLILKTCEQRGQVICCPHAQPTNGVTGIG